MRYVDKRSFDDIINDILLNKKFNRLSNDEHHGITRYDHCFNVSYLTYKVTRKICKNKYYIEIWKEIKLWL